MKTSSALAVAVASVSLVAALSAQGDIVGNRATTLRPLAGNVGVSNAVLRDQAEVRVLRVVVEPGGSRVMHAHTDVKFHLFVPISGQMELNLENAAPVNVTPWQPYFMTANTRHGFHNGGAAPVEIMEIFVK